MSALAQPDFLMKEFFVPAGDAGVYSTLNRMYQLVSGPMGVGSGLVRQAALEAVRGSVRDITEIPAIFRWVKKNIEFRDEHEETLQSPEATVNLGAGDCDDHTMLLAAMAGALGYEWDFKVVGVESDEHRGSHFSHVYAVIKDKRTGNWIRLDSTVKRAFAGWELPDNSEVKNVSLSAQGSLLCRRCN